MTEKASLFINGSWVTPEGGWEPVLNPATAESFGEGPVGSLSQADEAINAAHVAFHQGQWPRMSIRERVRKLEVMLDWLQEQSERIVRLIVTEAGATQLLANFLHFDIPMKHARASLEEALRLRPEPTLPEIAQDMLTGQHVLGAAVTEHEPVGVVAGITPYNFPYFLNIGKVFPALAMGNTVVLKPSPWTPFQALILGEAAEMAGLPKGVLNIVTGDLAVSQRLTTDPRIDLVSFTGSDTVGAAIMAQGAPTLKRMVLELGGKSAMILRADANLEAAILAGITSFTIHAGQGCALTTRHIVHNSIRQRYVAALKEMAESLPVGDPADSSVMMGPMIRPQAVERVERYVQAGLDAGASLVCGGRRPPELTRGYFYAPTIFDNVDNSSAIAQEEIFGPVACVIGFDKDEEAINLANASAFGLHGSIFSASTGKAYEMARQIRTGGVAINGGAGTMLSMAPFGGIKRSGMGREYGREGLLEFTYAKSISFHAG
ncbi:aldehyde dehydrogenase family protein [Sinimarinibacterium flocculans]|uniref:Acyl-CoA reductase-like NAD-dependent aldehyde dehydrogenase n=1 Tax=Sinimarinibacterium flocculans TaxID=985250 RepID=A0A318ELD3_9GAMM|nr:aldehyde dehydrogenase family protein [Sinimarinibacterium flocculans]PXV71654.1 acyl-CoA reductase-like NAD-dependent aldehyde dehydrogenase [Sinimarinibacterium flocculans]